MMKITLATLHVIIRTNLPFIVNTVCKFVLSVGSKLLRMVLSKPNTESNLISGCWSFIVDIKYPAETKFAVLFHNKSKRIMWCRCRYETYYMCIQLRVAKHLQKNNILSSWHNDEVTIILSLYNSCISL